MNIAITTIAGCPNNCTFCPQKLFINSYYKNSHQRLMSWTLFKRCIDKVPQNVGIDFGGFSEPFHNPLCAEMVVYAKKRNHRIRIYTTLVSMREKDVDILLANLALGKGEKDFIYVHLPSLEKFDHIRITEFYKRVLKKLVKQRLAQIVFLQHGTKVNQCLTEILDSTKINYFPLNTRASTSPLFSKHIIPRKKGAISCSLKLRDRILLPNGNVVICCQDFGLKHIVGNLFVSKYSDIINNQEVKFIQNAWIDESKDILCRYCEFAKNENAKAEFYSSPFYLGKIPLLLKTIIYNKYPRFYEYYKKNIKSGKQNNYLKW